MASAEDGKREILNNLDSNIKQRSGIKLAETLGINKKMISYAKTMLRELERCSEDEQARIRSLRRASEKRRIVFRVALQTAKLAKDKVLDREAILAVKEELLSNLDTLDNENAVEICQ